MSETILERVQSDTREAMRAGERERVGALRMLVSALQQDEKLGAGDEIAVLQRERKKRLEAAEAFRNGGRKDSAIAEEAEAVAIEAYLPEQLSDEDLGELVAVAIEKAGASGPADTGKVIGAVMPRVKGRADGKRVSEAVRGRLDS
jgi:uncharacterized protein YqeY